MAQLFDVQLNENDVALTEKELVAAMQEADVLVPTVTDKLHAGLIAQAGAQLKLIANFGAGTDHIDLKAAKEKGLVVTNTPSVLTEDTADITMALILAAPRRLSEGAALMRRGEWKGWAPTAMMGHRVNGKKLGLVGMGRIGQAVAHRARGFGMELHYHKRKQLHADVEKEMGVRYWADLDAMLEAVDIVSINCPYTPQTHHLFTAERLKKMGPDSYLINTARGAIIDEMALIEALQNGTIAGAGLDVYEHEPQVPQSLLELGNVVLLPHICSATVEGRTQMGEKVLINIQSFVDGHKPPDRLLLNQA